MKASKWHETWLEVLAGATSSTHRSTLSSMVCHQQAKVEFSGQGFLDSMNQNRSTQFNASALTPWTTPSTNARNLRVHCRGRHPCGDTPRMTAFVFAPRKPCNRPRIAVVWSA